MNRPLDRRTFLALAGATLAAAGLAACGQQSAGPKVDIGALPAIFADRESIERIGKHAVKVAQVGGRQRDVAAALAPNGSPTWLSTAGPPATRAHLQAQVSNDFAKDRIVNVAGWQLPLTEARVAALMYLSR